MSKKPLSPSLNKIPAATDDAREFAESVINTVREPLIILDQDLRTVSVSRSFCVFFKVKPEETIGQLIYDLGNKQWDIPKLRELLETILPEKTTFDNYEVEHDFPTIGKRIMLLNARQIHSALGKERIILLAIEDVTERKRVEIISRAENDRIRTILDLVGDPIFVKDNDHRITLANCAFYDMFCLDEKSVLGKTLAEAVPENERKQFLAVDRGVLDTGIPDLREETLTVKDLTRTIITRKTRFIDESGKSHLVGSIHDITERKQAEEALAENEEKLRTLFETMSEGIVYEDHDGRIVSANPAAERLLGLSLDQLQGRTSLDPRWKAIHEDGSPFPGETHSLNVAAKIGKPATGEVMGIYNPKSDAYVWLSVNSTPEFLPGKKAPFQAYAVFRDITERKRAEDALRESRKELDRFFEVSPEMMCIVGFDGCFKHLNPAWEKSLGYPRDMMLSKPFMEFVHPDDHEMTNTEAAKLTAGSKTIFFENRYRCNDGSYRWLSWSVIPAIEEKLLYGVARDITERKQAEESLRQIEEKFSKAFQTSPYAITITHAEDGRFVEVNDAFTAIAGYTREEALADSSIGMKLWVNGEERQRVVDDLRAGRAVNGHEYQFRTKVGKEIMGLFSAQIIKLGSDPCILSSINDITGRKQADTDLRIKNQVFEDSVASQSIADKNGVITHVNPAFLRLWGYAAKEQAIGNSVGSFFADPDDAKPVLEALAAHDAWKGEFRAKRVDGTTFISRGLATSLRNARGELVGYQSTNLDVTKEKEAAEALRESENKYRELFDNAEVGMYRSKLDGTAILAANQKLCEIFGCTEAELLGNPAVMRWADAGARNRMVAELRKTGFLKDYEIDILAKGGEIRTCSVSIKLYPDKGCLEGSAIDITERKRAGDALRESEQKFRDTIKHLDEGYYSCTAEGLVLEHNLAFNRILGFDLDRDMKGKKLPDFWQNPDERKEYLNELMTKGFVGNYLINAKKSDGEKVVVLANAHLVKDEKDTLVKIVGTFTDFTERKRAEEALRESERKLSEAQKMAQLGHWDWDIKTGKVVWSDQVYRIFQLDPDNFTPHIESILEFSPWPEDHERDKELIRKAMESHEKGSYEQRFLRPDKSIGYYDSTFQGKYDVQGNLVSIVGTVQDITERKRLENKLQQYNAQLEQKSRDLEQIVFVTSHDLRSPLVNVQGFAKELARSIVELMEAIQPGDISADTVRRIGPILKKDIPESLEYIQSGIARMDTQLSALLKLSRLGRAAITTEKLDMNRLVAEVVNTLEYVAKEKGADINAAKLPPCMADAAQTNQIFLNLTGNAVKYLDPKRPGVIRISGSKQESFVIYCIEDNGIGIAREYQARIFEIFYRVEQVNHSGEGLGLTIVRQAAEKQNGAVWVESEPGKGSRFFVKLPGV